MMPSGKQSPSPSHLKEILSQTMQISQKSNKENFPSPAAFSKTESSKPQSRSKKVKYEGCYDISFEKGLLKEHKTHFNNRLGLYAKEVVEILKQPDFSLFLT